MVQPCHDLCNLQQQRAGDAEGGEFCQLLQQLSSLPAAFTFPLTQRSQQLFFTLALPPISLPGTVHSVPSALSYPLVLQLMYRLTETSPWIIEMNDSGISLGIHITCHSRERENVIKTWSSEGTGLGSGVYLCAWASEWVCVCVGKRVMYFQD